MYIKQSLQSSNNQQRNGYLYVYVGIYFIKSLYIATQSTCLLFYYCPVVFIILFLLFYRSYVFPRVVGTQAVYKLIKTNNKQASRKQALSKAKKYIIHWIGNFLCTHEWLGATYEFIFLNATWMNKNWQCLLGALLNSEALLKKP